MKNYEKNLKDYDYLFCFDTETTGLNLLGKPEEGETSKIIELGAVLIKINHKDNSWEVVEKIDNFYKQLNPLPPEIVELTHITDEMLNEFGVDEIELYELIQRIRALPKVLWVAYNIQFDATGLTECVKRHSGDVNYVWDRDILDVMAVYKDYYAYSKLKDADGRCLGHRLDAAVSTFNVTVKNTHRAIDDVLAMVEVMKEMVKKLSEIDHFRPYINHLGYNQKYGVSYNKLPLVQYLPQFGGYKEIVDYYYKSRKEQVVEDYKVLGSTDEGEIREDRVSFYVTNTDKRIYKNCMQRLFQYEKISADQAVELFTKAKTSKKVELISSKGKRFVAYLTYAFLPEEQYKNKVWFTFD